MNDRRAVAAVLAGAGCIAASAILTRLSGSSPGAAAVFRCLFALPVLAVLLPIERTRRPGARLTVRGLWMIRVSGLLLALDLVLWTHAIEAVGTGLATVLGNLQVLIVGLLAWWLLHERLERTLLATLPMMVIGVALLGGLVGAHSYGAHPMLGVVYGALSSIAYAAFLLLLRHGMGAGQVGRTVQGGVVRALFEATAGALVGSIVLAAVFGDFRIGPVWPALGWLALLAVTSQVLGWLLITASLPRLPASLTSMLLLAQPVGALGLGMLVFDERPSVQQFYGVALVLLGVLIAATGGRLSSLRIRVGRPAAATNVAPATANQTS